MEILVSSCDCDRGDFLGNRHSGDILATNAREGAMVAWLGLPWFGLVWFGVNFLQWVGFYQDIPLPWILEVGNVRLSLIGGRLREVFG